MPWRSIEERWRWWRCDLGDPKYVLAPMVLQSELAFRMLVRKHGVTLCYAPMLPAAAFLAAPSDGNDEQPLTGGPATQAVWFTSHPDDRPLIAQLGGSEPSEMVRAALRVQDRVDGVDVNFGCPQRCAEVGGYGAYLMDDAERARAIIEALVAALDVPVTAKIRLLPSLDATVGFARMLEAAGIAAIAVHGRQRHAKQHEGAADWAAVRAVKAALRIPVMSNGNVRCKVDAERCLTETGVDAVMSACGLLSNPRLFSTLNARGSGGGGSAAVAEGDLGGVRGVRGGGGARGHRSGSSDSSGSSGSVCSSVSSSDVGDRGGAGSNGSACLWRDGRPTAAGRRSLAREYLDCARRYPDGVLPRMLSDHLLAILRPDLTLLDKAGRPIAPVHGGSGSEAAREARMWCARLKKRCKDFRALRTPDAYEIAVVEPLARGYERTSDDGGVSEHDRGAMAGSSVEMTAGYDGGGGGTAAGASMDGGGGGRRRKGRSARNVAAPAVTAMTLDAVAIAEAVKRGIVRRRRSQRAGGGAWYSYCSSLGLARLDGIAARWCSGAGSVALLVALTLMMRAV